MYWNILIMTTWPMYEHWNKNMSLNLDCCGEFWSINDSTINSHCPGHRSQVHKKTDIDSMTCWMWIECRSLQEVDLTFGSKFNCCAIYNSKQCMDLTGLLVWTKIKHYWFCSQTSEEKINLFNEQLFCRNTVPKLLENINNK